jgi:hypothetical protein
LFGLQLLISLSCGIWEQNRMTELLGRPTRNDTSQRRESFQIYILLILGIGFIGAGISMMGFAAYSLGVIGVGAGAQVAAGLISIFLFLRSVGSSGPRERI